MSTSQSDSAGADDAGFDEEALHALEVAHPDGLSTQQVVDAFAARGAPLSEATFRKYVQLGLLPRSVRVARQGKRRGSQGLYPASVVRQVDLIRRLMAKGYTIGEIQSEFMFLGADIDSVARQLKQLLAVAEKAIGQREGVAPDEVAQRALSEAKGLSEQLVERLRSIEKRLAMRARMARAAV